MEKTVANKFRNLQEELLKTYDLFNEFIKGSLLENPKTRMTRKHTI